jgi:hypothetical protein
LSRCAEGTEKYVLLIEWVATEEHLEGFRREPNFKSFFSLVQAYIANAEERQHYQLTEGVGKGSGGDEKKSVAWEAAYR